MLIAFLVRIQALMGSLNTLWYGSEQAWGHTELNYSHQRSPVMRLGADICAAMSLAAKLKKKSVDGARSGLLSLAGLSPARTVTLHLQHYGASLPSHPESGKPEGRRGDAGTSAQIRGFGFPGSSTQQRYPSQLFCEG